MRTLLIVDDEELFRKSLGDGLAAVDPGWTVLTADSGTSARKVLESQPVDLVLTDLHMPGGSGLDLLTYLVEARPWIPALVVTAYGTPETADQLSRMGVGGLLEKPLDFESLVRRITEIFASSAGGVVRGIPLATFLQVLELERKSCTLRVSSGGKVGWLHLVDGELDAAECGELADEAAACEIVCWDDALLEILATPPPVTRRISMPLRKLMFESFRRRDEIAAGRSSDGPQAPSVSTELAADSRGDAATSRKERLMSAQDKLKELAAIDGFAGAGVFTPQGESLALITSGTGFSKEIGVLANAVLMNAQKASLEMGAGRGQQVHITAEKAHILVRCLNEGNDPLKSEPGKAHIHLVMALSDDSAIGMAKMRINSVIEKLGPDFRG